MRTPGFHADAALSASISPQMAGGSIFGTLSCYGGCLWRYLSCISRCGSDFECGICQAHLTLCPLICTPIVFD
jgi:hypothetical protein